MPKAQKPTVKARATAPAKKVGGQARTTPAKSTPVKAAAPAKRTAAGTKAAAPAKSAAKTTKSPAPAKTPAKTTKAATPAKTAVAAKTPAPAKVAAKGAPATKAATGNAKASASTTKVPAAGAKPTAPAKKAVVLDKFLLEQRAMLQAERSDYVEKAAELKAEADSLALEHEPGDIQFDEEGGEGGTTNVDRELDLVLSAQARAAVDEIDRALAKIAGGTYGLCERCGKEIPKPRLKALPYAALCVQCKSGGLSRR
jgi:DnaK suppressor protein